MGVSRSAPSPAEQHVSRYATISGGPGRQHCPTRDPDVLHLVRLQNSAHTIDGSRFPGDWGSRRTARAAHRCARVATRRDDRGIHQPGVVCDARPVWRVPLGREE
jgi:hypothetical protein